MSPRSYHARFAAENHCGTIAPYAPYTVIRVGCVPSSFRSLRRVIVIEVGAPYPAGRDTMGILYDWCIRRLPYRDGAPGTNISVWRDSFVRSDTGWRRVGHAPAVAPTGCTD